MADTLTAEFHLTGNANYAKGLAIAQAFETFQIGQNAFPSQDITYASGTASGQINKYVVKQYVIPATTLNPIDLAGVVVDDLGNTVTFTAVKEIIVALDAPDGVLKVRVGPQAVANPFIGPWTGGQGATVYEDVYVVQRWTNPYAGWTVTAGTGDIFQIYNPGAGPVTVDVVIMGVG